MQLTNPIALWLLSLIPLLVLIHNLRPRPKRLKVTNLFLWKIVMKDKSGGFRIQRAIKDNLPLLLQLLLILITCFSLAKPVWYYSAPHRENAIIVLDASASMKAQTPSGDTRFQIAKEKAIHIIEGLSNQSKAMIIVGGNEPEIASSFSNKKVELKKILNQVTPTDMPGDLEKTIFLALSFTDPAPNDNIYLITDGIDEGMDLNAPEYQKVHPLFISGGQFNVGITQFEFRESMASPDYFEIMVEIQNFNPETITCPIKIVIDKMRITENTIELSPHEKKLLFYSYRGAVKGKAMAEILIEDDFNVDNKAYCILRESKDTWVLLVTKENIFIKKMLEIYPNFRVNTIDQIVESSFADQVMRHDIVIIDRFDFPKVDKGNFILFQSYSPGIPIEKSNTISHPLVLDWDRMSPIMANLEVGDLFIESADKLVMGNEVAPVLESNETDLVVTYGKNDLRAVFFGFDITHSDLPFRVAFPMVMNNIFKFLAPDHFSFTASKVKSGTPFSIQLGWDSKLISIRNPEGKWEKYHVNSNPFIFKDTSKTGFYLVAEGKKRHHIAVNLIDAAESNIWREPSWKDLDMDRPLTPEDRKKTKIPKTLWYLLLFFSPLVLLFEWHFWLNKKRSV